VQPKSVNHKREVLDVSPTVDALTVQGKLQEARSLAHNVWVLQVDCGNTQERGNAALLDNLLAALHELPKQAQSRNGLEHNRPVCLEHLNALQEHRRDAPRKYLRMKRHCVGVSVC
jgi:hypothetical protein